MKVSSVIPPNARQISLTFPQDQGWAIVAALREYADRHPDAQHREDWRNWAEALDKELRK